MEPRERKPPPKLRDFVLTERKPAARPKRKKDENGDKLPLSIKEFTVAEKEIELESTQPQQQPSEVKEPLPQKPRIDTAPFVDIPLVDHHEEPEKKLSLCEYLAKLLKFY